VNGEPWTGKTGDKKHKQQKELISRRLTQTDADDSADKPVGTKGAVPFGQRGKYSPKK